MMFASFYSNGTIPSYNDKLNTGASDMLICSIISYCNLRGMPSTPDDLFSLISLILATTVYLNIMYMLWISSNRLTYSRARSLQVFPAGICQSAYKYNIGRGYSK